MLISEIGKIVVNTLKKQYIDLEHLDINIKTLMENGYLYLLNEDEKLNLKFIRDLRERSLEILENPIRFFTIKELEKYSYKFSGNSFDDQIRNDKLLMELVVKLFILKGYFASFKKDDIITNSKLQEVENIVLPGLDSKHSVKVIPKNIGYLKSLKWLTIEDLSISKIPESLLNLKSLLSLNLSSNCLKSIPQSIYKLKNLVELDLYDNQIESLPESIGQLKNLTKLILSQNKIKTIPNSISQLEYLEEIELAYNNLTELPVQIANIKSLIICYINHNQIKIENQNYPKNILSKFAGLLEQK